MKNLFWSSLLLSQLFLLVLWAPSRFAGHAQTATLYAPPPFGPPAPTYPQSTPAGTVPAALPDELMIGLGNINTDWMRDSGSKWQARYQYITGGVNTDANWTTWNAPRGQFATNYLNADAGTGVIPVFTYYQILQSNPRPYDESLSAYAEKFGNAATMKAYYDDFKLLMMKCHASDKTVIVHVEPDVWGYLQREQPNAKKLCRQSRGFGPRRCQRFAR